MGRAVGSFPTSMSNCWLALRRWADATTIHNWDFQELRRPSNDAIEGHKHDAVPDAQSLRNVGAPQSLIVQLDNPKHAPARRVSRTLSCRELVSQVSGNALHQTCGTTRLQRHFRRRPFRMCFQSISDRLPRRPLSAAIIIRLTIQDLSHPFARDPKLPSHIQKSRLPMLSPPSHDGRPARLVFGSPSLVLSADIFRILTQYSPHFVTRNPQRLTHNPGTRLVMTLPPTHDDRSVRLDLGSPRVLLSPAVLRMVT